MRRRSNVRSAGVAVVLAGLLSGPAWAGAGVELIVLDDPGEGFNDPAAWTPRGGNPATTVGEARRRVVEFGLATWTELLDSPVPIRVGISFSPLGGDATAALLGQGGPTDVYRDFVGAPAAATWYPAALADKLAGVDLAPGELDMTLEFNSEVDGPVVLGEQAFYYGLDGDMEGDVAFLETVLHEAGHGLGFVTYVHPTTGAKMLGYDDAYLLRLVRAGATVEPLAAMTNAERAAAMQADGELQWQGPAVATYAANLTAGTTPEGRVLLDTTGSGGRHFHADVAPDPFMEALYLGSPPDYGLTRALFEDLGWGAGPPCTPVP